jgi:hypothetical protein
MSWITRGFTLVAITLAGCLWSPAPGPLAQDAAGGSIVITLPADLSAEQRDALVEALGRLGQPIVVDDPAAVPAAEEGAVGGVAVALGRFDDAMLAATQVPGLIAAWWRGLSDQRGLGSLLAVLAVAVAVAGGLGLEYLVDRLLAGWRRACLEARPTRFAPKLGHAVGWFVIEVLGLVVFGIGAILGGWLMLPDTAIARLTLAVVVVAIVRARLLLALAHLVFAPRAPNLRLIAMADADAALVWRWILMAVLIAAVAFGVRDILAGAGTRPEA